MDETRQEEEIIEPPQEQPEQKLTSDDWDYYLKPIQIWFTKTFLKKKIAKQQADKETILDLQAQIRQMEEVYLQHTQALVSKFEDNQRVTQRALQTSENRLRTAKRWEQRVDISRSDLTRDVAFRVKVNEAVWQYHDKKAIFQDVMQKIAHEFTYWQEQ